MSCPCHARVVRVRRRSVARRLSWRGRAAGRSGRSPRISRSPSNRCAKLLDKHTGCPLSEPAVCFQVSAISRSRRRTYRGSRVRVPGRDLRHASDTGHDRPASRGPGTGADQLQSGLAALSSRATSTKGQDESADRAWRPRRERTVCSPRAGARIGRSAPSRADPKGGFVTTIRAGDTAALCLACRHSAAADCSAFATQVSKARIRKRLSRRTDRWNPQSQARRSW
jgi:hypothetical protein